MTTLYLTTKTKPHYGSPCNNCGQCCLIIQCPLSAAMFGKVARCPALEVGDEGCDLVCGLARSPERFFKTDRWSATTFKEAIGVMLGAGLGCDSETSEDIPLIVAARRPGLRAAGVAAYENASPEAKTLVDFFRGGAP